MAEDPFFEDDSRLLLPNAFEFVLNGELKRAVRSQNYLTLVTLETSRDNKLTSGRRYVVFLSWPRETLPVAVLDLPPTDGDYTATLPARLDMPVNALPAPQPRN